MTIITLKQRKAAEVARIRTAVAQLCEELAVYGRDHGGRFLLYGSAARGAIRYDSDVDLLLDFPDHESTTAAWTFAEPTCGRLGLKDEISPVNWSDQRFIQHIMPDARFLP